MVFDEILKLIGWAIEEKQIVVKIGGNFLVIFFHVWFQEL